MPTTAEDEKIIKGAMASLILATDRCSKSELHYLWRRGVLPPDLFHWILQYRKENVK